MVTQAVFEQDWNAMKATLKSKWQQLSDRELRGFNGTADQLVQMIQRRTGQARNVIENQLEEIFAQGKSMQGQAEQLFSNAAAQAEDAYSEGYEFAAEKISEGYRYASKYAKDNPGAAVAILFGSGLLAGLGAAMLLSRR